MSAAALVHVVSAVVSDQAFVLTFDHAPLVAGDPNACQLGATIFNAVDIDGMSCVYSDPLLPLVGPDAWSVFDPDAYSFAGGGALVDTSGTAT